MEYKIKKITLYAASSSQIDPVYFDAAQRLGELMARYHITCINGAGSRGLMACVSNAILAAGGEVIGVIPQFMIDEGWSHNSLSETIITDDMHKRKQMMAEMSDGCIALPGGVGTMEELLEIITWKQLGLYTKPIVILNTNSFYDELLGMLEKVKKEKFMHPKHATMWYVASEPEDAFRYIMENPAWENNPRSFAAM